ncbi:MAG: hypothetical protein QF444_05690 [Phycisphaerales bacterium]|jgi:hypothetical protein|nr:hypothetical protein [Phycisphaerales bacterium]
MVQKTFYNFAIVLIVTLSSAAFADPEVVTLFREGSRVLEAEATLQLFDDVSPTTVILEPGEGSGSNKMVVFPNQRLAEMEAVVSQKPENRFRVSGEVFTYNNANFLLIREVVSIGKSAKRKSPTAQPTSPDIDTVNDKHDDDSIASIVADLEKATGTLARSIRSAVNNPVESFSPRTEGVRITNRRGHVVRNNYGAWVFVFVSDATGLSDPPCTILPSSVSRKLFSFASRGGLAAPVLLSGEVMTYHGHDFLVLRSWRTVHGADHLEG